MYTEPGRWHGCVVFFKLAHIFFLHLFYKMQILMLFHFYFVLLFNKTHAHFITLHMQFSNMHTHFVYWIKSGEHFMKQKLRIEIKLAYKLKNTCAFYLMGEWKRNGFKKKPCSRHLPGSVHVTIYSAVAC